MPPPVSRNGHPKAPLFCAEEQAAGLGRPVKLIFSVGLEQVNPSGSALETTVAIEEEKKLKFVNGSDGRFAVVPKPCTVESLRLSTAAAFSEPPGKTAEQVFVTPCHDTPRSSLLIIDGDPGDTGSASINIRLRLAKRYAECAY